MDQHNPAANCFSSLSNLGFLGAGVYLPSRAISNSELASSCRVDPAWVEKKLGIVERRVVAEDEQTSDLAAAACREALASAGISVDEINLLIVATATPDRQAPSTACTVLRKLGLERAIAFDVSAVCAGFMYAMATAANFLQSGSVRRALVVGADTFTRITDWSSDDCVFFGDGAGAVVLESRGGRTAPFYCSLTADSSALDFFTVPPAERQFKMDREGVYKTARRLLREVVNSTLAAAGVSSNEIAYVVPHQASLKLLGDVASDIGVGFDKFHLNMGRVANTAGATVPIAFAEAWGSGAFRPNDWTLFLAAGAGMTAGAALYRWPAE
ncbi:3-oxoacyl-ACP synthase III family protein [Sinorhizobium meliloti]|uniref:3-oxoacyl-ACP synthase III family protein n=1 Tax=Rhizobium meliloti TaxID=382 RepID=UPI003F147837